MKRMIILLAMWLFFLVAIREVDAATREISSTVLTNFLTLTGFDSDHSSQITELLTDAKYQGGKATRVYYPAGIGDPGYPNGNANTNESQERFAICYQLLPGGVVDLSDKIIRITYWIPDHMFKMPGNDFLNIRFYTDGTYANYGNIALAPHGPGDNVIEVDQSAFTFQGTATDLTAITDVGIFSKVASGSQDENGDYIQNTNTTNSNIENPWSITFDQIEYWDKPAFSRCQVLWEFDDGFLSSLEKGIDYLYAHGMNSIMFISGERMGTGAGDATFCTWDQIAEAAAKNCLICPHAQFDTPTDTEANLRAFYVTQRQYLIDHGYSEGLDYWAIPGGQEQWSTAPQNISAKRHKEIAEEYFIFVRGTAPLWQSSLDSEGGGIAGGSARATPIYPKDYSWGSVVYLSTSQVEATANTANELAIDIAIANSSLIALTTHDINSAGAAVLQATFENAVDYVATKRAAGDLEVIRLTDLIPAQAATAPARGAFYNTFFSQ